MPGWVGSDRREDLPPNWQALRKKRFELDGNRCTAIRQDGSRCPKPAEECDHIGERTDHRIEMLRSLCAWHHARKTGQQGAAAKAALYRRNQSRFRRSEAHPGSLV